MQWTSQVVHCVIFISNQPLSRRLPGTDFLGGGGGVQGGSRVGTPPEVFSTPPPPPQTGFCDPPIVSKFTITLYIFKHSYKFTYIYLNTTVSILMKKHPPKYFSTPPPPKSKGSELYSSVHYCPCHLKLLLAPQSTVNVVVNIVAERY